MPAEPKNDMAVSTYAGTSGRLIVQASAHGNTAGFLWLLNPVGSAKVIKIRRVSFQSVPTAISVFASTPRITVERMTFTGTCTASVITAGKRLTADANPTGLLVAATTGTTPASGATLHAFTVPPILTAVGVAVPVEQEWEPPAEDEIELVAGEGLVIRQPDAGTTSDTRLVTVNIDWKEHD